MGLNGTKTAREKRLTCRKTQVKKKNKALRRGSNTFPSRTEWHVPSTSLVFNQRGTCEILLKSELLQTHTESRKRSIFLRLEKRCHAVTFIKPTSSASPLLKRHFLPVWRNLPRVLSWAASFAINDPFLLSDRFLRACSVFSLMWGGSH